MKKLALFDIDGVVYEGHSIFDVIQDQEKRGFIKTGIWNKILVLLERYKKGRMNYKQAADAMLLVYAQTLKGKKYAEIFEDHVRFIERNNDRILVYFEGLVTGLLRTYDIYFVTTNFDFCAEAFAKYFGITGFLSSKIGVNDGIVNGELELSLGGNKGIVRDLIGKYGKEGSIAVGDSENDVDMLEKVEYPFVMEPNEKLKLVADEKGWKVVDRKTITDKIKSLSAMVD